MDVQIRLSQEQYANLVSALTEAIESAAGGYAEALRKHNIPRAKRHRENGVVYKNLRDILDIQYSHGGC